MEFRILGPVEIWDGVRRLDLRGAKPRAVLAVLLVHANQVVSTHRLIDELWGEAPPPTARNVLQCHVSRLRRALHHSHDRGAPTQILSTQQHGYLLRVEPGQLDLHRFEELLAQARSASAEQDYEQAADRLRGALALWRGPALADVDSATLSWTVGARLEEARLVALEERVEADLALGRHAEVVGELEALVASHPARERPRRQLMLALYRSGRPTEALGVYRSTRQVLVEEFGLEPSPALQQLERAILLADPALEPARPGAGHRRRPPPSKGPCQLPPDLLDFTGRDQMVRALTDCLAGGGARLPGRSGPRAVATISGPAGTGKTALALHVAHRLRRSYPDGQLWADLRGLEEEPADPPGVLAQFLRALDPDMSIPGDLGERVSQYRALLADRRVLVVLDNAASETQVRPLLPAGGRCGVLVTGRRRLSVLEGATLFDLGVFSPAESLELLGRIVGHHRVADARDAALGIATMCGQLPLAIRIAGARLRARPHLTLERFSSRLADERSRLDALAVGDREVRSSLAVSHRVLDPQARRLFRLIAVLTAPEVTVWSAAALLDVPEPQGEELVEELVEARLLDVARVDGSGTVHVGMHDLVRLYAREQAAATGTTADDGAALERAFGAALYLAERAQEGLPGGLPPLTRGRAPRWPVSSAMVEQVRDDPVGWFESERAGLVAAVEQAATLGLDELAWDLAGCLGRFLEMRGYFDDWRIVQDAALVAVRAAGNANGEACLLCATGERHIDQDRYGDALEAFTKALATFESLGDRHGAAHARRSLGGAYRMLGRADDALGCFEQVIPVFRDLDDTAGLAEALYGLGMVHSEHGRDTATLACYDEALHHFRQCGNRLNEAHVVCSIGALHLHQERLDMAETALREGLDACRRIGHAHGEVFALAHLGELHTRRGETPAALERLHAALAICGEIVERAGEATALRNLGELHRQMGELDQARAFLERALELCESLQWPLRTAQTLRSLGDLAAATGDADAAQAAWRTAHDLFLQCWGPEMAEETRALLDGGDLGDVALGAR